MVTLNSDYIKFGAVTTNLLDISRRAQVLDVIYQKLIAETLVLRLFYELDKCVEGMTLKLVRGALYLDGSAPRLLMPPFSSQGTARQFMLSRRRGNARFYLEWTTLSKIKANLSGIVDPADHFLITRDLHDGVYENIRHVRNHVAHNTSSTKAKFSGVIQAVYLNPAGINAGKFLLSQRAAISGYSGGEMIVAQYIKWSKTFIKALSKSPI